MKRNCPTVGSDVGCELKRPKAGPLRSGNAVWSLALAIAQRTWPAHFIYNQSLSTDFVLQHGAREFMQIMKNDAIHTTQYSLKMFTIANPTLTEFLCEWLGLTDVIIILRCCLRPLINREGGDLPVWDEFLA